MTITYDPSAFTVAPTDISLGTVTAGWNLVSTVDQSTGTIDFHVNAAASGTSVINLGAATYLADTGGPLTLTLTPAPTDGDDVDDGSVTSSADEAWIAAVAQSTTSTSDLDAVFAEAQ